ncbi:Cleft lip and palate transmembrane protein 1 like protein [Desmophyllum pertusum]|uniref:Cleft lip and palate transmembrane protein 1 like protein n=1 Tax=Desmophyllum pertusum TaxID=174260 RepID=A0A9W9ZNA9_9CNID|nr:Cleft lip and palate transmembrane protein 1 like protein [Desmophyllum pertusum]
MDGSRLHSTTIQASERLQSNGTLYAHVYVTKHGKSPRPNAPNVLTDLLSADSFQKKRVHKTVNLLTGVTDAHPDTVQVILSCLVLNKYWNLASDYMPTQRDNKMANVRVSANEDRSGFQCWEMNAQQSEEEQDSIKVRLSAL